MPLLPVDEDVHYMGSVCILASDIFQIELTMFTKVLLNGPGVNGPLEMSHF